MWLEMKNGKVRFSYLTNKIDENAEIGKISLQFGEIAKTAQRESTRFFLNDKNF